jgi:hypothetical protein
MKNLNEPRKRSEEITPADVNKKPVPQTEGEIVPFERRVESRLLAGPEAEEMKSRWNGIQTHFVDDPRKAVQEADELVGSAVKRIADAFSQERGKLEDQWKRGGQVSTEDLRVALQHYRAFFSRLLSL